MSFLKKLRWFLLIGYLILAILWALNIGLNRDELLKYDGNKLYNNIITSISESYLTENGDLILCLSGYLKDSEKYRVMLSEFTVKIPVIAISKKEMYIEKGIKINNAKTFLYASEKTFGDECKSSRIQNQKIPIGNINLTKKETYFFNQFKYFKNLKLTNNEPYTIVSVPNYSYSQGLYPKTLDLYIVAKDPDVAGRIYYALKLEDSVIYREISFWEYSKAFTKDFVLFPIQLYMFFNWH